MLRTMTDSVEQCDCGATAGPLGLCADYYHRILIEEQTDPQMYRWHAPVVCAYLLQHPAEAHDKHLDGQFRWLQFYLDKGMDAMIRVQRHQVARNNHRARSSYDQAPLAPYAPLPAGKSLGLFRATFSGLPFDDDSFVFDGHTAYGCRIDAIVAATLESWESVRA
jgi:hypothetical protein